MVAETRCDSKKQYTTNVMRRLVERIHVFYEGSLGARKLKRFRYGKTQSRELQKNYYRG